MAHQLDDEHDPERLAAILDACTGSQLVTILGKLEVATAGGLPLVCTREHEPTWHGLIHRPTEEGLTLAEVLSAVFAHGRVHHLADPFG